MVGSLCLYMVCGIGGDDNMCENRGATSDCEVNDRVSEYKQKVQRVEAFKGRERVVVWQFRLTTTASRQLPSNRKALSAASNQTAKSDVSVAVLKTPQPLTAPPSNAYCS